MAACSTRRELLAATLALVPSVAFAGITRPPPPCEPTPRTCDPCPRASSAFAVQPGALALDSGSAVPGNPFLTALIELLESETPLDQWPARLCERTRVHSDGFMHPTWKGPTEPASWSVSPRRRREQRRAFVLMFATYGAPSLPDLPGILVDATRATRAFRKAGFDVSLVVDPSNEDLTTFVDTLPARTAEVDVAALYASGHAVQHGGRDYLLSPHSEWNRAEALARTALPLATLIEGLQARSVNLAFFGGCRNDPVPPPA